MFTQVHLTNHFFPANVDLNQIGEVKTGKTLRKQMHANMEQGVTSTERTNTEGELKRLGTKLRVYAGIESYDGTDNQV